MNQKAPTNITADRLRLAARQLFASQGYDGTSVREITSAAGANLGAITYHFGSKAALYNQVVADCALPLADAVLEATNRREPVLDRIAGVVRAYFDALSSDEDQGRIMVQALVIGRQAPDSAADTIRRVHGALHALVLEGQEQGVLRAGDARMLSLSIVSVPLHLVLIRRALKANLGIDLDDAVQREAAIQHAIRFVREALASHPGETP